MDVMTVVMLDGGDVGGGTRDTHAPTDGLKVWEMIADPPAPRQKKINPWYPGVPSLQRPSFILGFNY